MEGPSLVILKEQMQPFIGKRVLKAKGYADIDIKGLKNKVLRKVETWGKHFIFTIGMRTYRSHFLLFGSYAINEPTKRNPTLSLTFANGVVHFFICSIKEIIEPLDEVYDWRVDVMSPQWDPKHVAKLIRKDRERMVCDILLDQNIFSGAGNIIKNEALFNLRMHPETIVRNLSPKQISSLIKEGHDYSHRFYTWKKKFVLKKHFQIYHKKFCPISGDEIEVRDTGKLKRRSYYCPVCQKKY